MGSKLKRNFCNCTVSLNFTFEYSRSFPRNANGKFSFSCSNRHENSFEMKFISKSWVAKPYFTSLRFQSRINCTVAWNARPLWVIGRRRCRKALSSAKMQTFSRQFPKTDDETSSPTMCWQIGRRTENEINFVHTAVESRRRREQAKRVSEFVPQQLKSLCRN